MTEFDRRSVLRIGAAAITTGTLVSVGTTGADEHCPCSPSAEPSDWPSLGGNPGNNSYVSGTTGPEPPIETAWEYDRDGRIAVVDGTVYLRTDGGEVHALDADDGSVEWRTEDLGADETPAVAHDTVVVGGEALTAIDATDGEVRWRLELDYDYAIPSPNVADDLVFVVADGVLYAVDVRDGEEAWRFEPEGEPLHEQVVAIVDGAVIVASETRLFARDVSDGTERWTNDDPNDGNEPFTNWTPLATSDFVVVKRGYGNAALSLHDVESGEQVRELSGTHYGRAAATPDGVYAPIGMHHYFVRGYDAATGDEKWEPEANGEGTRPPIVDGENVYTGLRSYNESTDDDEQWVRFFAFDTEDGSVNWEIDTETIVWPLALVDETLYLSADGLIAVRSEDASEGDESDSEADNGESDDSPEDGDETDAENGTDADGDPDDGTGDGADGGDESSDDDTETGGQNGDETDDAGNESDETDDGDESAEDGDGDENGDDGVPGFTVGTGLVGGGFALEWLRRRAKTDERAEE